MRQRPRVLTGSEYAWDTFHELSLGRRWSSGAGGSVPDPIPFSEIVAWLNEHRVEGAERDALLYIVRAVDREYVSAWNRKAESEAALRSAAAQHGGRR